METELQMPERPLVCKRQDTFLPAQNQPSNRELDVKKLLVTRLRIERAIALQVWRMQHCKKYSEDYIFDQHLGWLLEALGYVILTIQAASEQQVNDAA